MSGRFAFIAVAVAASAVLIVFGFNRFANENEETLLAQAWAEQATVEPQLEPLDLPDSDMAELEIVEFANDAGDLSSGEDSFDWMFVAISNQWNSENRDLQEQQETVGGTSDEG